MKIQCQVLDGPLAGQVFDIEGQQALVIGRGAQCNLRVPADQMLSRHHCILEFSPPRCFLRDLGSRNGTFVNGSRVKEAELRPGDRVQAGTTVLRIHAKYPEPAETRAPVQCARCRRETRDEETFDTSAEGRSGARICAECRETLASVPEVFPGHKIVRKLGEGGMGAVYLATNLKTGALVAVKTLRPERATESSSVQMFLREALSNAQLEHPNAVRFLSNGYTNGLFYFLMEYVDGPDLQRYLDENLRRPMTLAEALPIFMHVLAAVDHAHGKKMVHRDIKPANILIAGLPYAPCAKLSDFGLMRKFEATGYTQITKTGQGKGTLEHMAPEQILDAKHAGPAADIYALGSTLFTMLTRDTALDFTDREDPSQAVLAILEAEPRPIRTLNPSIPATVDAVVASCLEKNPLRRPASVRDLALALRQAAAGS